jgi:hypothetical protein
MGILALRLARTSRLLVSYMVFLKGVLLLALGLSMSSCAPQTAPIPQIPTPTTPIVLDSDGMTELSGIQIPKGLADPDGKVAYVVGPQALIHRLDLKSGKSQAHTTFAGSPLAIQGETLIAWTRAAESSNAVRLLAVTPQMGILRPVWEQTIELPAWVEVDSPEAERFNMQAEIQDEELVVTWQARSRYTGGAPPPADVESSETRQASKDMHIDPESGSVLKEEQREIVPVTETSLPSLPSDRSIVPYLQGEAWATHPWTINTGDAYLVRIIGEPGILLVRREPGSAAGPLEIRLTGDPTAVAAVTPDSKFIFIHETRNDPASWLVFSAVDGEIIAKIPFDSGAQGVSVVNDQVLYLVMQEDGLTRRSSLHSRDLHTGEKMWSFALEDEISTTAPPPPP